MLEGYKTYTGIVVALLGAIGISKFFTDGEVTQIADIIITVAGLVIAAYGRYKAKNK